jgi:drug/metabolite transporter (DMT)-like permease
MLLVFGSALVWSFGGAIARTIEADDIWTIVFWRASWASVFLLCFMIVRDGVHGTLALLRGIGRPGLALAACFATASTTFIVALSYTTVANILLMQAGVPLIAALIAWAVLRERVDPPTWAAITAVIIGVAVMVSDSLTGNVSLIGNCLALLISIAFASATVITRRYSQVRMTPAGCLATMIAACVAFTLNKSLAVSAADMGLLFGFGALNLGLGLVLFVTGARLVPAAIAALIGTLETVLGPVWVWLSHGEIPSGRTIIGGMMVFFALILHLGWQYHKQRHIMKTATPT